MALADMDRDPRAVYADPDDPLGQVIDLDEAARRTGRSRRTLNRWIQAGQLATLPGLPGRYVIERAVLECERDRHRAARRGRPGARVRLDALT